MVFRFIDENLDSDFYNKGTETGYSVYLACLPFDKVFHLIKWNTIVSQFRGLELFELKNRVLIRTKEVVHSSRPDFNVEIRVGQKYYFQWIY